MPEGNPSGLIPLLVFELRRKRKITFGGVGVILLVICVLLAVLHEVRKEELLAQAKLLEVIARESGDFRIAIRAYEDLLDRYPHSSRARAAAQLAFEHLRLMDGPSGLFRPTEDDRTETDPAKLKKLKSLLAQAKEAEEKEKFEDAHKLLREASRIAKRLKARRVYFPLKITSYPSGAELWVNDKKFGSTPIVLKYDPGAEVVLTFTARGCEETRVPVTLETQHELHFKLKRKPTEEFVLPTQTPSALELTR